MLKANNGEEEKKKTRLKVGKENKKTFKVKVLPTL